MDEGQELENSTRLAHLEVEAGGCPVVFRQHVRRFADGTGRCALSLSSLLSVPPPQWFLRDVYKRQLHTYILVPKDRELPAHLPEGTVVRTPLSKSVIYSSVPVSYTHLDVYKRQPPKFAPSRDKIPIDRNFAICFSTARELIPIL